ncbi:Flavodoxin reductases (ferredoxin-NADPH reductases) family 1 [Fulvivirga imtechensis AK7]|uniref:Flavodoxin reductases (Ferredoxin-NADPH reductases) family 1 n=1 Tax=Fulvivirga imtechensis AK7 TaxID=1237149 RepID=L8JNG8_9BACT|nr:ferredoxin--NADP reductase [Fulvivirga imtechensis]ELR68917.1 Flavodoxin reductases (ferredoxin-NADPH reductases) family 1 [Fulvivirga imtechensis AK7]
MAFSFFKKNKEEKEQKDQGNEVHNRYFNLKVKEIIQETKDAITIVFDKPEQKLTYKSGQFLTLIVPVDDKEIRRAYSLCSSPFVDNDPAVTVKRVEGGLMSNWLPDHLKVGDTVKVMEPMGVFTTEYKADNKRHIVMFAGGSGITPMMSITKSTLTQEPESIISLIYCNRDIDSIIFKEQLEALQTDYEGRFHVIHILDDAPMNWQGHSGLLNHDMLVKIFERIPNWGPDNTTYLMCGPEGMMKNVENLLEEQKINKDHIFKESFVAGTIDKELKKEGAEPSDSEIVTREVTVIYDGEEHKFTVEPDATILETALDLGIDLPYSCQSGLCTACRGKCISGKVKLDEEEGLSDAELEEGYVLTCVGHPLTDDVIIEIG